MNCRSVHGRWVILHVSVWSLLIGIFVFQSAPIVGHAVFEYKIAPIEANHTTDNYVGAFTGVKNGSQWLNDAVRSLPEGKPVVIFVRDGNSQSEFLGMLIAYLSWPREVRTVRVQNTAEREVAAIDPSSVAGLMFCQVDPPRWFGKGFRLGSSILIVPGPEAKQ